MRMYMRLILLLLSSFYQKRRSMMTGESVLHFRVMPWDCVFKLVGNDRYLAFMDLGRIDLLIRMGGFNLLSGNGFHPFVYSVHIRYFQSLRIFQRFAIRTRLVHCDKRFFVIEQIFENGPTIFATAISKSGMTNGGRIIPTAELLPAIKKQFNNYSYASLSKIARVEQLLRKLKVY